MQTTQQIKYSGKISFTMGENHPDKGFVKDYTKNKLFTFEDIYYFNADYYTTEEIQAFIKRDLRLVAGGGYNTENIDNVTFEIKRM